MKRRAKIALTLIFLGFVVILGRLVEIQVFQHQRWLAQAARIQEREIINHHRRGQILDRAGRPLARDIKTTSIALDNYHMTKPEVLRKILKERLSLTDDYLEERIYRESYFTWIKRKVVPNAAEEIKKAVEELEAKGLIFVEEWQRVYPQGQLASNLIGFAGLDNQGLEGTELGFDGLLQGREEVIRIVKGGDGSVIGKQVLKPGRPGDDLVLTIDSGIQLIAEQKIMEGVEQYQAKDGFVIIMDPLAGEILAMAQAKRYNLNRFQESLPEERLNLAVSYPFEPGSAFKIFAGLAALEYGAISPDDWFSGNEPVVIAGYRFHNAMRMSYGAVRLKDIIKLSINTGMIRVAQRLGEESLYQFLKRMNFGELTGLGLPGEVAGTLRPLSEWSKLAIGAIPIGQSVSVTGIQLITAAAAIANGGLLLRPQIVKEVHREGKVIERSKPQVIRRIASPENVEIMKEIMREAVKSGTGGPAEIKGFAVAGKTGTAQKAIPGIGYVEGKYTSLFVGFFPVEKPELIILVVLDEVGTKPFWGGQTAGVIFREIAERIIDLRNLHPLAD